MASSHLFTLRIWEEKDEDGTTRWRGKIHHISSEEVHYFIGWAGLVPLLLDILRRHSKSPPLYFFPSLDTEEPPSGE